MPSTALAGSQDAGSVAYTLPADALQPCRMLVVAADTQLWGVTLLAGGSSKPMISATLRQRHAVALQAGLGPTARNSARIRKAVTLHTGVMGTICDEKPAAAETIHPIKTFANILSRNNSGTQPGTLVESLFFQYVSKVHRWKPRCGGSLCDTHAEDLQPGQDLCRVAGHPQRLLLRRIQHYLVD